MLEDCWEMAWCLPQLFHVYEAKDKMPLKSDSHAVFVLSCTSYVEFIYLTVNLCNSFLSWALSLQLSIFLNISFSLHCWMCKTVHPKGSSLPVLLHLCSLGSTAAKLIFPPDTLNTAPFYFQFQFPFSLLPFANSFAYLYFPSVFYSSFSSFPWKSFTMATCSHLSPHFLHLPTLLYVLYSNQPVKPHSTMHR